MIPTPRSPPELQLTAYTNHRSDPKKTGYQSSTQIQTTLMLDRTFEIADSSRVHDTTAVVGSRGEAELLSESPRRLTSTVRIRGDSTVIDAITRYGCQPAATRVRRKSRHAEHRDRWYTRGRRAMVED